MTVSHAAPLYHLLKGSSTSAFFAFLMTNCFQVVMLLMLTLSTNYSLGITHFFKGLLATCFIWKGIQEFYKSHVVDFSTNEQLCVVTYLQCTIFGI